MFNQEQVSIKDRSQLFWEGMKIFMGANLIAAFTNIKIFLPNNPVPIVFQTTVVLLLSILMGRKAAYCVLLFIIEGLIGLPVFAKGGGFLYLFGATGGYIFGYLVASYVVGIISENLQNKTLAKAFYAMALGKGLIFFFGCLHLSTFVGFSQAILLGVLPFLGPDLLKLFLNVCILKKVNWAHR